MLIRRPVKTCPVCSTRTVKESSSVPVCDECWEEIPTVESIRYFEDVRRAKFTRDPRKTMVDAESRVVNALRVRR